jgi:subtilisin family serine protease
VPRRLSIVVAAALCALAAAAAAAGEPSSEWWLQAIDANPAAAPGPGVPIVVIDGAVDQTQPAFAGRANTTYLDSPNLAGPQDFHATSVAALAAASGPDGFTGVYPQAALELWDAGRGADGIDGTSAARGIIAAAAHCPAVINLSFGGSQPSPDIEAAIFRAVRAGCLVVAAAGNSGLDGDPETYPASYPHVFTVGATDEQGNPETFSSSGPWVDVAAPGVDMTAPVPLTTDPSGFSSGLAGTSFSAPLVSAAAAWIWTVRPTLTASQVAQLLRESAGPQQFDTKTGFGVIDVAAALALPTPPPDPVEPNDDVAEVKPGFFFSSGQPPITTSTHPSTRLAGTVMESEDPRDLYRIWIPARRKVHVSLTAKGSAVAQIWGPATVSLDESQALRKRDLAGSSITGGAKGAYAYVEVTLTGRTQSSTYVLTVRAATR